MALGEGAFRASNERCDLLATGEARKVRQTHTAQELKRALDEFLAGRDESGGQLQLEGGDAAE